MGDFALLPDAVRKGEKAVRRVSLILLAGALSSAALAAENTGRWSKEKAARWYAEQP